MSNPHRDYAPFEIPENMEEDLGLFHAAVQPRCKDLSVDSFERVLLLVDGEPSSVAVRQIASDVAGFFSATIDEFPCSERDKLLPEQLEAYGIVVAPRRGLTTHWDDANNVQHCVRSIFETSRVPVLCVDEADLGGDSSRYWSQALAAVSRNSHPDWLALSWAFRLAKDKVTILEWVDAETRGTVSLGSLDESAIGRSVTSQLGPLVGAAQRYAKVHGVRVHVEFRLGSPAAEILSSAKSNHASIIVLARSDSEGDAHDRVAGSLLLEPQSQSMPPLLLIV